MSLRPLIVALALSIGAGTAFGQLRSIPAEAKRGEMRHLQDMIVEIDGRQARLAPGAQIRDASNMIVLPAALPPGAAVKYTVEPNGMVHRVWIMTPLERAQPDPRK
jgi:hypothetical protein